jgi:hypothetical protein
MSADGATVGLAGAVAILASWIFHFIEANHSKHLVEAARKQARAAEDRNTILEDGNRLLRDQLDRERDTKLEALAADVASAIFAEDAGIALLPLLGRAAVLLNDSSDVLLSIQAFKQLVQARQGSQPADQVTISELLDQQLKFLFKIILVRSSTLTEKQAETLMQSAMSMKGRLNKDPSYTSTTGLQRSAP